MAIDRKTIGYMTDTIPAGILNRIRKSADLIVEAKKQGKKVIAVVGSGPNIHEGVTTLIAELIHKGIIDGVTTSSAVINHEMGGTLEKVKRVNGRRLGISEHYLPADGYMEAGIIPDNLLKKYAALFNEIDVKRYKDMLNSEGDTIIKVAGNIAYPTGLYTELVSRTILKLARKKKVPFELIAGKGADPMTMIGAGDRKGVPGNTAVSWSHRRPDPLPGRSRRGQHHVRDGEGAHVGVWGEAGDRGAKGAYQGAGHL